MFINVICFFWLQFVALRKLQIFLIRYKVFIKIGWISNVDTNFLNSVISNYYSMIFARLTSECYSHYWLLVQQTADWASTLPAVFSSHREVCYPSRCGWLYMTLAASQTWLWCTNTPTPTLVVHLMSGALLYYNCLVECTASATL